MKNIKIVLVNPKNRWERNSRLFRALKNQKGFDVTIVNSLRQCKTAARRRVDICFLPGDNFGMRTLGLFRNGSTTVNLYDAPRNTLARAKRMATNVVGLNTRRL